MVRRQAMCEATAFLCFCAWGFGGQDETRRDIQLAGRRDASGLFGGTGRWEEGERRWRSEGQDETRPDETGREKRSELRGKGRDETRSTAREETAAEDTRRDETRQG